MLMKSYVISELDGISIHERYLNARMVNISNIDISLEDLRKQLERCSPYDICHDILLVHFDTGYLAIPPAYGYTMDALVKHIHAAFELHKKELLYTEAYKPDKALKQTVKFNNNVYHHAALYADETALAVSDSYDVRLIDSMQCKVQLQLEDLIHLLFEGVIDLKCAQEDYVEDNCLPELVFKATRLPRYAVIDSPDCYLNVSYESLRSLFTVEQYQASDDCMDFVKSLCAQFLHSDGVNKVTLLKLISECPFSMDTFVEIAASSRVLPLMYAMDSYYVTESMTRSEFPTTLGMLEAYENRREGGIKSFENKVTDIIIDFADTFLDWECEFVRWMENSINGACPCTEGPLYRFLKLSDKLYSLDKRILWAMISLLYTRDGKCVKNEENRKRVEFSCAVILNTLFVGGRLCMWYDEVCYVDAKGYIYTIEDHGAAQSEDYCPPFCELLSEVEELLLATDGFEPTGVLALLESNDITGPEIPFI